jgi:hypothetical protein
MELNPAELMAVDGGKIVADSVVTLGVAVGSAAGIFFPPVGFAVAIFGVGYAVARLFAK